jgi:hypothetical protein
MTTNNNHPHPGARRDGTFESERAGRTPPVQHNSGTMRSAPAGGEVPRGQYADKAPRPASATSESLPLKHRNDR